MDSGLGVQWPLSPYATALAAGALVGFCIALWRTSGDPESGKDLDPPKQDGKEKDKDSKRDFPDSGDVRPTDCERLRVSGAFGAIPRTVQRIQPPPSTRQLYEAFRRRLVENRTWQEINSAPASSFSCIYQQSFQFRNELSARLVLNVSPYLGRYLNLQQDSSRRREWPRDFDVSLHPDVLKDRPITRSAIRLTLEKQLRQILGNEPPSPVRSYHRAIEGNNYLSDSNGNVSVSRSESNPKSDSENETPSDVASLECANIFSENSSLWDSGFCEKSLDGRWSVQRDSDDDNNRTGSPTRSSTYSTESSDPETVLFVGRGADEPCVCLSSSADTNTEFSFNDDSPEGIDDIECLKFEIDNTDSKPVEAEKEIMDNSSDMRPENNQCNNDNTDSKPSTVVAEKEMIDNLSDMLPENNQCNNDSTDSKPTAVVAEKEIMDHLADMRSENNQCDNERELSRENSSRAMDSEPGVNGEHSSDEKSTRNAESDSGIHVEALNDEVNVSQLERDVHKSLEDLSSIVRNLDLESVQNTSSSYEQDGQISEDEGEQCLAAKVDVLEKIQDEVFRSSASSGSGSSMDEIKKRLGSCERDFSLSAALRVEKSRSRVVLESDVTRGGSSRDPGGFEEGETRLASRQMDRETGERSVAVESSVTAESSRLSTSVVSRLTLDHWPADREDSVSVKTTISEEVYRPTFEEFIPLPSTPKEEEEDALFESPAQRADRLQKLLQRDEERRSRTKFQHLSGGPAAGETAMEGEWDRLLRDVLASVSELERWERRHCDVRADAEEQQHPSASQSDSSFAMEEGAPSKGETPTKVKNLRFKLDPDVFDVPSDDSFYDDEPVRLVSVHASVVPAGQKMVARPIGIDLRVRLTEERQSKRAHVSTSPSQAKRRSPVSDRGWCQELSPVTENVDWRETFTVVSAGPRSVQNGKTVPNGILKTPSPKSDPLPVESPNPFKGENGVPANGVADHGVSPPVDRKPITKPKCNGVSWKPLEKKPFSLPRKKFEPDPDAVERITGYKSALSKPPLPPPITDKANALKIAAIKKAELARKQYLDNKAALSAKQQGDGMQKFQQFLNQAQTDRARIVTSVPDLAAIEKAVTEQWKKERASASPRESPLREDSAENGDGHSVNGDVHLSRGGTPDDKWASYVQSCRKHLGRRSQSMTYLETDIDVIPVLDEDDKSASTSALDESDEALPDPDDSDPDRSREDLDDSGRAKSEHELRIERSLRSLPLPDWYKRSEKPKTGFLLGSSAAKEKRGGWAAAKSLASSTSSLASCGLRRGPVRSLRSSRENIPWSRSSASPDGPTLSLALAKAFREPYLGWRARTPTSSGVSSSPRASPPSWGNTTTDDEANGVSFDGEDAFGRTTSSEEDRKDEPLSLDDTGADAVTVSMDTNDPVKLAGGEDTCDDINNMSMDTCELFDASVVVPVDEDPSPQADTGDDIDNLSTDTATENRKMDPKLKRYSYSQSIYHSEWEEPAESRGDRKVKERSSNGLKSSSPDHKIVWIESSFVGSRTTTSIMVLPECDSASRKAQGNNVQERPASR